MRSGIYDLYDAVRVLFPFSDLSRSKRRPALIISSHAVFRKMGGHAVIAMITSTAHSAFPLDILLKSPNDARLPKTSTVRMKLFTIQHSLIETKLSVLHASDRKRVSAALHALISPLE